MYCGAVFPNTQHNTFNVLIPKYAPHALQSTVTTIKQCTSTVATVGEVYK